MSEAEQLIFQFGPFQLDASRRLLYRDAQPVTIAPKTLDTLDKLLKVMITVTIIYVLILGGTMVYQTLQNGSNPS